MKKNLFLTLAAMLLTSLFSTATAQIVGSRTTAITKEVVAPTIEKYSRFGVSYLGVGAVSSDDSQSIFDGFSIDYISGIPLSNSLPLYLEIGANLDLGFKSDNDVNTMYLAANVPFNITYKFKISDNFAIAPYAGLGVKVIGLCFSSYQGETADFMSSDEMGDYVWNRFHINWRVGANIEFGKVYLGVTYGSDFTEIITSSESHLTRFSVGLGFVF